MELEALEVRRHAWAAHNTRREGDMAVGGKKVAHVHGQRRWTQRQCKGVRAALMQRAAKRGSGCALGTTH